MFGRLNTTGSRKAGGGKEEDDEEEKGKDRIVTDDEDVVRAVGEGLERLLKVRETL